MFENSKPPTVPQYYAAARLPRHPDLEDDFVINQ
jgi:hypothetical protein